VKVLNAEQAGATFVVIHNHASGGDELVSMGGGAVGDQVTISSIFVGPHERARGMVSWHGLHPDEAQLELVMQPAQVGNTPDRVATFSSRGPAVGNLLKPDIAAPGVNIVAQGYGGGSGEERHFGYGQVSGTSMAAPHVSGAAALVRQIHPDWSNAWIKSALMSTAKYTDVFVAGGTPAQPLDIGAGRLDLTNTADPGVILNPPSLSFGQVVTGTNPMLTVEVTSVSDEEEQYQLHTVYTGSGFEDVKPVPGLGVSMRSITVAPGETATFDVTWNTGLAGGYGDNQGYVLLTGETHQAHMPAWIRIAPPPSDKDVLIIDNDGSSIMTETLRAIPNAPESYTDYTGVYTTTLDNTGFTFDVWDADAHNGTSDTTIPDAAYLSQYKVVLYQTGDFWHPDSSTPGFTAPTSLDANRLVEYANGGGRVIAFGQDLSSAFGLPNFSPFYGFTLGGNYIQDSVSANEVFTTTPQIITGMPGTPFSQMVLDISDMGDGAGNQAFVDEVFPDDGQMGPFKYAMGGSVQGDGFVAFSHRDEPTLERPGTTYAGRGIHFAFGLEGVNNDTGYTPREDLLYYAMIWALDEATTAITHTLGAANEVSYFQAPVTTNWGEEPFTYRWDFGDGTPFMEETSSGSNVFGHVYRRPGTYTVRVQAADDLGTTAIDQVEITIGDVAEYVDRRPVIFMPLLGWVLAERGDP